jgi:multidrug efflux system membrane fusion protein
MQRKTVIGTVLVVAALGGGAWVARNHRGEAHAAGAPAASGKGPEDRVVPVIAATVEPRDMPIYLEGIGSVTAFNTVTVKPQVEGRLDKVAFREGQDVKKGDLLAQIDPRPFQIQLQQAEAALARDRAQLAGNQRNLDRYTELRKEGLATQQQVDDLRTAVGQVEATLRADQAQIEAARLQLGYARITAPIDGVTGVRMVDPGNLVKATDPNGIVVITQLDPIAVLFTLPQDDLPHVAQQMELGTLAVEAWSRDGNTKLATGELLLIDNQINQNTATMRLKATFANPQRLLWPNQFVKARLLVSVRKGALVVPATAVQRGPDGTFAWLVLADETVQPRRIEVDLTQGDLAAIARGLSPGEVVVTDGASGLRPGAKVAPRAPAQKPAQPSGRALGAER